MTAKTPAEIDFKKYRTPELFETVSELVDWRGTMGRGFYQAFLATFVIGVSVTSLLCALTYFFQARDWRLFVMLALMLVLCIPGGLPAGIFYAIAYLLRRSLSNMLLVVDLLLETTKNVAKDINAVRTGDSEMPSAKQLVQGVYLEVFLPILEQVIADQLWIFATPALFLYRLTFGRLMRFVIRILPEKSMDKLTEHVDGTDLQTAADNITDKMAALADQETLIVSALDWTQEQLKHVGGRTKFIVMLPCYLIAASVIIANILAMVVLWLMFTAGLSALGPAT